MKDGQLLCKLRREKSVSQEELANALKVTRQTVSKWENGQMPISEDKRAEITCFFGIDKFESELAAARAAKPKFTANQKIIIFVIAVFIALSCCVTVIVGCVSLPGYRADKKGATSLYVDPGYFWLALAVTLIIAGLEVFAVIAYRKENLKKQNV